jgi:hypothetical protein
MEKKRAWKQLAAIAYSITTFLIRKRCRVNAYAPFTDLDVTCPNTVRVFTRSLSGQYGGDSGPQQLNEETIEQVSKPMNKCFAVQRDSGPLAVQSESSN